MLNVIYALDGIERIQSWDAHFNALFWLRLPQFCSVSICLMSPSSCVAVVHVY